MRNKIALALIIPALVLAGCKGPGSPLKNMTDNLPGGKITSVWEGGTHQFCVKDVAHKHTQEVCRDINGPLKAQLAAHGYKKGACYPGDLHEVGDALGHHEANCVDKGYDW